MPAKDERIGIRVPKGMKAALLRIARKEGRSMAQICDLLLKGGISEYDKEGSHYIQRILTRSKENGS